MGIERNHIILNQSANEYPSMEISKKKKKRIKEKERREKGRKKKHTRAVENPLMSINNLLYISLITDEYLYL